jgi:cytochrome c oxidase subunit II
MARVLHSKRHGSTLRETATFVTLAMSLCAATAPMAVSAQSARGVAPAPAVICEFCHGARGEGLPALEAPRLAGLPAWYIEKQLRNFKAGIRGGPGSDESAATMGRIAGTLVTDKDIGAVGEYFASMPQSAAAPRGTHGSAEQGRVAFQQCAGCHGVDGAGNGHLEAPPLRGANDWYVVRELTDFHEGRRGQDPRDTGGQSMRAIAQSIAKDAAADLAAYIQTLR